MMHDPFIVVGIQAPNPRPFRIRRGRTCLQQGHHDPRRPLDLAELVQGNRLRWLDKVSQECSHPCRWGIGVRPLSGNRNGLPRPAHSRGQSLMTGPRLPEIATKRPSSWAERQGPIMTLAP